jgi:hypothetical protein
MYVYLFHPKGTEVFGVNENYFDYLLDSDDPISSEVLDMFQIPSVPGWFCGKHEARGLMEFQTSETEFYFRDPVRNELVAVFNLIYKEPGRLYYKNARLK